MRVRTGLFAVLSTLLVAGMLAGRAASAQELTGTWQGKLQVDANTAMVIRFTFDKKPDGTLSAVLNSPDNSAIKNVAAESVKWQAGALSLQVPSLSGSFAGTLQGGSITGQWKQPGSALPLVLSPYVKPVLSKEAINTLLGSWNGPLGIPQPLTFLVEFKQDDKGQLAGSLTFAEQPIQIPPFTDIQFADNKLIANVQMPQGIPGQYTATYSNGVLTGVWRAGNPLQPPAGVPLVLKKGVYVAQVHVLKMPPEAFGMLAGTWRGDLHVTPPQGAPITLPVVLRFETNKNTDMVAFMDSPNQHVKDVAVTEASLVAGKAVVKIAAIMGEFDATLSGNTLTGDWKQGPNSLPLTMTRK